MPRRALVSFLLFLTGAAGLAAGTLDLEKKNTRFQPGHALQSAVVGPSQAKVVTGDKRITGVTVQKIIPILQMPAKVELNRTKFHEPREAKIQPSVQSAVIH